MGTVSGCDGATAPSTPPPAASTMYYPPVAQPLSVDQAVQLGETIAGEIGAMIAAQTQPYLAAVEQLVAALLSEQQQVLVPLIEQAETVAADVESLIRDYYARQGLPAPPIVVPPPLPLPQLPATIAVPAAPGLIAVQPAPLTAVSIGAGATPLPGPAAGTPHAAPPPPAMTVEELITQYLSQGAALPPASPAVPVSMPSGVIGGGGPESAGGGQPPAGGRAASSGPCDPCAAAGLALQLAGAAAASASQSAGSVDQLVKTLLGVSTATATGGAGGVGGAGGAGGGGGAGGAGGAAAAAALGGAGGPGGAAEVTVEIAAPSVPAPLPALPLTPLPPAEGGDQPNAPEAGLPPPKEKGAKVQVLGEAFAKVPDADTTPGRTWLQRLNRVRFWLRAVGKAFLAAEHGRPTSGSLGLTTWTALLDAVGLSGQVESDVVSELVRLTDEDTLRDLRTQWLQTLTAQLADRQWGYLYVSIARSLLLAILELSTTGHWDRAVSVDLGLHIPGAQAGAGHSISSGGGAAAKLPAVVVPLLEVCDLVLQSEAPTETLSLRETVDLWRRGLIPDDDAEALVRYQGGVWEEWQRLEVGGSVQPSPAEIVAWCKRRGHPLETAKREARRAGASDTRTTEILWQLYEEIPPTTDLLRFAQRNVTVPEVVDRFTLDSEFDRFWRDDLKEGLTAQGVSERWARLYWRSHWITPPVTTGYLAVARLRPGRVPKELEFTLSDLENLFRENDVAPFWRKRLLALAYRPIAFRYLRQLYLDGSMSKKELRARLEDLQYTTEDAITIADSYEVAKLRADVKAADGLTPARLLTYWLESLLTDIQVTHELEAQQYTEEQIAAWFRQAHLQRSARDRKASIELLHQRMLHGTITREQAFDSLIKLPMDGHEASQLTNTWAEHTHYSSPHNAAPQLLAWLKDGVISPQEVYQRLLLLHWTPADAQRAIYQTSRQVSVAREKTAKRAIKEHQAQVAKAMTAQQKAVHEAELRTKHAAKVQAGLATANDAAVLIGELAILGALKEEDLVGATTKEEKAAVRKAAILAAGRARAEAKRAAARTKAKAETLPPP